MKSPLMPAGGMAQIADHLPRTFKGMSSNHLMPNFSHFIFEIHVLSFLKMGVAHNKAVALRVRHDSTVFWVWKIDLGANVSPASKDGTQSCFYDCVIVTLPFCRKQNK